jgi:hypothetical protein
MPRCLVERNVAAIAQAAVMLTATAAYAAGVPVIFSAVPNYPASQIAIGGQNFSPTGLAPTVRLGKSTLTLASFGNLSIVANLPASFAPASYRLTVTNSNQQAGSLIVVLGAVGASGPQGPRGAAGDRKSVV